MSGVYKAEMGFTCQALSYLVDAERNEVIKKQTKYHFKSTITIDISEESLINEGKRGDFNRNQSRGGRK